MDVAQAAIPAPKPRKRAKKIKGVLGPYQTSAVYFDAGERKVEIVGMTPASITYRLQGRNDEYTIPHGMVFQRAVSIEHNIDLSPRQGRIRRGVL